MYILSQGQRLIIYGTRDQLKPFWQTCLMSTNTYDSEKSCSLGLFENCLITLKFGRHCRQGTGLCRRLPTTQYATWVMYKNLIRLVVFPLPTFHCKLYHILIPTSTTLLFCSWQISIIYTNVHRCTHQWGDMEMINLYFQQQRIFAILYMSLMFTPTPA